MNTTMNTGAASLSDERINELAMLNIGYDRAIRPVDFARAIEREVLARQPAAIDNEADDDIEEAREILENMVRSIELDGNYSTEATCTFLRQALNCLPVAAPLANEANKPAPSVEHDERGALTDEQIGEALLDTLVFKLHANNDQVRRFRDAFHFASACDAMLVDVEEVKQLCRDFSSRTGSVYIKDVESALDGIASRAASTSANVAQGANLDVWYGSMPESNGKSNWTAILHKGDLAEGHTIDRSEYPDRVRYAADCVRYLIGELKERPWILDYDADKHSGYVANAAQGAEAVTENGKPASLYFRAGRNQGLQEALYACKREHLEEPAATADDIAYTSAIDDCLKAIGRLLADQSASGDKS